MKKYNFYSPSNIGNMPVRVLENNILSWFQNITPDFLDDLTHEVEHNNFNNNIFYNIDEVKITDVAEISGSKQIVIYENYNQFLWCICYLLIVLYYEVLIYPLKENKYTGKIDQSNTKIKTAISSFNNAMNLFHRYENTSFFQHPNPENYDEDEKKYVEEANGIYLSTMAFTLLHEFGHQYYGHLDYYPATNKERKKDEIYADDYAFDKMKNKFTSQKHDTFKVGIIASICSFIFFDKSLKSDEIHPDPDDRLKILIEQMYLNDDDEIWWIASSAFVVWAKAYSVDLQLPKEVDNFKVIFECVLDSAKKIKRNSS
jgi:hypothetical protein